MRNPSLNDASCISEASLRRYVTFTATVLLDFSVASKASYSVTAQAKGVYQVDILDLGGAQHMDAYMTAVNCMLRPSMHSRHTVFVRLLFISLKGVAAT